MGFRVYGVLYGALIWGYVIVWGLSGALKGHQGLSASEAWGLGWGVSDLGSSGNEGPFCRSPL